MSRYCHYCEDRLENEEVCNNPNCPLSHVDFDDAEICFAMLQPVLMFNTALPPVRTRYGTHSFPYEGPWLLGITAYLFQIAGEHYRRNELVYSAAGVTIADKSKAPLYLPTAEKRLDDYRQWVKQQRISINLGNSNASLASGYSWTRLGRWGIR